MLENQMVIGADAAYEDAFVPAPSAEDISEKIIRDFDDFAEFICEGLFASYWTARARRLLAVFSPKQQREQARGHAAIKAMHALVIAKPQSLTDNERAIRAAIVQGIADKALQVVGDRS